KPLPNPHRASHLNNRTYAVVGFGDGAQRAPGRPRNLFSRWLWRLCRHSQRERRMLAGAPRGSATLQTSHENADRASHLNKEHMEDQDRRNESQPNSAQEQPNGTHADGQPTSADDTQVGQVLQGLAKVTRQLPVVQTTPSRRTDARAVQQATRER